MDELKLKHLLSRRFAVIDNDRLLLQNRIKSEHLFISVEESLEYLYTIIREKPLNPDDPFFISYKENPLLVINIVDEAIVSMIYEIYQQIYRKDESMLSAYRNQIEAFYFELQNKADGVDMSNYEYRYYHSLLVLLIRIMYLCVPDNERSKREETRPYQLSYSYYVLMYTFYNNAKPKDSYFGMLEHYYYKLLIHRAPDHRTAFPNIEH